MNKRELKKALRKMEVPERLLKTADGEEKTCACLYEMLTDRYSPVIARIRKMEELYDELSSAVKKKGALKGDRMIQAAKELSAYMAEGKWLRDFELDEEGLIPASVKRGVLSEDALYDLLGEAKVMTLLKKQG